MCLIVVRKVINCTCNMYMWSFGGWIGWQLNSQQICPQKYNMSMS